MLARFLPAYQPTFAETLADIDSESIKFDQLTRIDKVSIENDGVFAYALMADVGVQVIYPAMRCANDAI